MHVPYRGDSAETLREVRDHLILELPDQVEVRRHARQVDDDVVDPRVDEPINEPKSAKPEHKVQLWIGGGGEKVTLKLVAQYADACNVGRDPEVCKHKLEVLKGHCENVGRNYDEIIRSAELDAIIVNEGDDADEIRKNLLFDYTIVGKAEEIRAYVQRLIDAGIDYIIVYLPGVATNLDLIGQFEDEVIAHFA